MSLESVIHSDGWSGYDGLVDVGYKKHFRVKHSKNQFAERSNHINGIEAFWSSAKRRLSKFNGVHHHTFYSAPQGMRVPIQSPKPRPLLGPSSNCSVTIRYSGSAS